MISSIANSCLPRRLIIAELNIEEIRNIIAPSHGLFSKVAANSASLRVRLVSSKSQTAAQCGYMYKQAEVRSTSGCGLTSPSNIHLLGGSWKPFANVQPHQRSDLLAFLKNRCTTHLLRLDPLGVIGEFTIGAHVSSTQLSLSSRIHSVSFTFRAPDFCYERLEHTEESFKATQLARLGSMLQPGTRMSIGNC